MNKLTQKAAEKQGFTIDGHCSPPIGYKGPRFAPTESVYLYTELESKIKEDLNEALDMLQNIEAYDDGQMWKERNGGDLEKILIKHNRL